MKFSDSGWDKVRMEKDYTDSSDEELILRLRDGDSQITEFIMDNYKKMVS